MVKYRNSDWRTRKLKCDRRWNASVHKDGDPRDRMLGYRGVDLTYFEPSGVSKSTVLTGATTMNGMLCLAASTAAL